MRMMIRKWSPFLLITLTGLLLYSGITKTYAFTDAYDFVYSADHPDFIKVFFQGGRPIYGFIMKWSYLAINGIEELYILRILALIFAISFSGYFFSYMRREGNNVYESLFVALIVLLSPSLSIKILWSVIWILPLVLWISFYSGVSLVNYQRHGKVLDLVVAIIGGLVVLLTYQPLFTFSIIPLFLNWIKTKDFKELVKLGLIHLSLYLIYFLIFKFYLRFLDIPSLERAGISTNIFERMQWFITGPLIKGFTWSLFFVSSGFRWAIRAIIIIGLIWSVMSYSKLSFKYFLINSIILFLFLLGSYIPNILSSDSWMSYRTMDTLLLIPILSIWFSIKKSRVSDLSKKVIYALFLFFSFAMAFFNINRGFIDIQVAEYNAVNKKMASLDENTNTLLFIPPPLKLVQDEKILKRVITDEFGRLSSSSTWVPEPMTRLILRSNGKNESLKLFVMESDKEIMNNHNRVTIDVGSLFLEEIKN